MPHSDEFGLDDDDTEFLAAATQFEGPQCTEFDQSPRPTKKRRLERRSGDLDGEFPGGPDWSVTDDEDAGEPFDPQQGVANGENPPLRNHESENEPDETDDDYFPGELGPVDDSAKRCKYKIHVPATGGRLPDFIFSQTQHNLDNDPTALRGAVWKRPHPHVLSEMVNGASRSSANGPLASKALLTRTVCANGITNYFQAAQRSNVVEDDAALAARLQREEDILARDQHTSRPSMAPSVLDKEFDVPQDLADLPSDAFSSSSPEKSMAKSTANSRPRQPGLRGPQVGLKQMTMFGQPATQDLSTSQAANKRHAWPLKSKDEPPTHHKLDEQAMATWVYPTNLGTTRDYQYNIVARSLFHNTLIALPTGLGKTFIAATIMLNYHRWTTDAQLVFVAPTKPLIAQQLDACYNIVGIPRRDTVLMTGETSPNVRAEEWRKRRVFFMTPQTVVNDLKTGICDPKKIVLLVVDEAHKATGSYAYTEVVAFLRRFNPSFRVVALTATPGSTVEGVQNVIDSLGIARVELRTEQSLDIRPYTFEKHTEVELFDYDDEQSRIMGLISQALQPAVDKLCQQNAYWSRDPMNLTAYGLTDQRRRWMASEAGRKAPQPVKGMLNAIFTVLSKLAHNIGLLKSHGIRPFYSGMLSFQNSVQSGESKGKTASSIVHSEPFVKMMSTLRVWTNDSDFIGHPKLEYLREVVLGHFLDAGEGRQGSDVPPSATRVMVFASYRDSTEDICRVLKRNEPMVRPHVFVGQAASKESEGMNQKRQNEVIQDFKSGKYNVLVATSIGEEGLDIGTVDLIVNYDTSSSPIRMLQRNGRTARKRTGRVVLLLMKGKEERDYEKAQDTYIGIQKTIADESKYEYRDDQSPRILPRHAQPIVDKRPVDIPVENSQPIDMNERARKARGKGKTKRPAKKFHMPDGVRTGFVRASKLGSDDDDDDSDEQVVPKKRAAQTRISDRSKKVPPSPEPEVAQLPYLGDVLLTDAQRDDHRRKYTRTFDSTNDAVISAPDGSQFPDMVRDLGPTKFIRHSRRAQLVEKAMQAVHAVDESQTERTKEALQLSDFEDVGVLHARLVRPQSLPDLQKAVTGKPNRVGGRSKKMANGTSRATSAICPSSGSESDLPDLSVPCPPKSKRPREQPSTAAQLSPACGSDSRTNPHPIVRSNPSPTKQREVRKRPTKQQPPQRPFSYGSSAAEGSESSPEPTPANMHISTQGIDLGSRDTSGEDEEEEPDSELAAFIAGSSDPIEMASSSLPKTPMGRNPRRGLKRKARRKSEAEALTDLEEEESAMESLSDSDDGEEEVASEVERVARKKRGRRIVEESDDE